MNVIPTEFMVKPWCPISSTAAVVAHFYGITPASILGTSRSRPHVYPRQLAMLLASEVLGKSAHAIGRAFDRDHSTVLHGIKAASQRVAADDAVRAEATILIQFITAQKLRAA